MQTKIILDPIGIEKNVVSTQKLLLVPADKIHAAVSESGFAQ